MTAVLLGPPDSNSFCSNSERTGGFDDERVRLGGGRRRPVRGDGMRERKSGHRWIRPPLRPPLIARAELREGCGCCRPHVIAVLSATVAEGPGSVLVQLEQLSRR